MSNVFIHLIVSFDKLAFSNKQKYVKSPISKMCNDKYRVHFRLLRYTFQVYLLLKIWVRRKSNLWSCRQFLKLKWAWAKLVEEWKNFSRQCIIISAMDECEKAGEVCPSALQCLKQDDGSFACDCDANSKVVGEGDARTCQGTDYF